jgi:uncharacterized protein (DUF885 family)
MRIRTLLAAVALIAALGSINLGPARAQSTPGKDAAAQAHALFDDYWQWTLRENPEIATFVGDHRYDDRLSDQSAAAAERRRAMRAEFVGMIRT